MCRERNPFPRRYSYRRFFFPRLPFHFARAAHYTYCIVWSDRKLAQLLDLNHLCSGFAFGKHPKWLLESHPFSVCQIVRWALFIIDRTHEDGIFVATRWIDEASAIELFPQRFISILRLITFMALVSIVFTALKMAELAEFFLAFF